MLTGATLKNRAIYFAVTAAVIIFLSPFIATFISGYLSSLGSMAAYVANFLSVIVILILAEFAFKRYLGI